MDNLSYIIGLNNGEGGGGASSWSDLDGKPFNTIGEGLTTTLSKALTIDESIVATTTTLQNYATTNSLATVATTGDYRDLLNLPTIPAVSATSSLSSGTTIGMVTVNGETTTFYAPEGGSVSIDNKSIVENLQGQLETAVPLYSEQVVVPGATYGPGLLLEGPVSAGSYDFDIIHNMPSSSYLGFGVGNTYRVTAEIDGEVYSGSWSCIDYEGHTYGGYSWVLDNGDTWELYIENLGSLLYNIAKEGLQSCIIPDIQNR